MELTGVFAAACALTVAQTADGKNVRFNDWLENGQFRNLELTMPPFAEKGTRFAMDAPFKALTAVADELVI